MVEGVVVGEVVVVGESVLEEVVDEEILVDEMVVESGQSVVAFPPPSTPLGSGGTGPLWRKGAV